jgi:hypothetical protein
MEEKKWIYRTEIAGGFSFKLFSSRKGQIEELSNKLGEEGWELCGFSINHFNLRYILVFKKET